MLGEVLHGTTDGQVFVHLIVGIHSHEGLALHTKGLVALHGSTDGRTCIYDTLVDNRHSTIVIIHDIVGILHQGHTTCRHHHRAWCYVGGSQIYLVGGRTLVLTREQELVLLGHLLGGGLCGVV